MSNLDQLQQILTKEVSRKEFLQHIGVFILGAAGISAFMSHFFKLSGYQPEKNTGASQSNAYGARPYGR